MKHCLEVDVLRQEHEEVPDAMRAASNVYGLVMENDRVRVLRVVFKPGDRAPMHHHPDHTIYVVKGGKLDLTSPLGKTESMELRSGKAIFMESQSHEATNVGDTDIELIVVELK